MSMIISRKALVGGLALAGLGLSTFVATAHGQDASRPAAAPASPPAVPAAIIGSIDLDRVFKDYEKVKEQSEKFKAEAMKRQQELTALVEKGKNAATMLEKMKRDSPDYQKLDNQVVQIQAELQAKQQSFQKEFAKKESETLASLYNEVSEMVKAVARQRHLTFVVKISNEPVQGDDPQTVMAAMAKTVVYNDPSTDITDAVVQYLNIRYQKSKSVVDSQATPASAPAQTPVNGAAPKAAAPKAAPR